MQRKPATWLMVLALAGAPLWAAPVTGWAQETADETKDETDEDDDATSPEAPDETSDETPAEPEDETEGEEATETVEEAPTPPPASPAGSPGTAGASTAPGPAAPMPTDAEEEEAAVGEDKVNNAAAMGAASPVVTSDAEAKRWLISANLQSSLGSSVVADRNNDPVFGYAFSGTGLYKITGLWQGRLDAYGFLTFNQNLSEGAFTNLQGGTGRNQFFLQDVQLGVLGRGIYTERNTGIIFGFRSIGRLPTSELAQAVDRVFRWDNGVTATKPFPNTGPGTVIVSFSQTFRKDFGPRNPTIDTGESPSLVSACASANAESATACFSDTAPLDWASITSFGARYLLNNGIGFNLAFSMLYNRFHAIRVDQLRFGTEDVVDVNGQVVPVNPDGSVDVDSSRFADSTVSADQNLLLFGSISLSYVFNANWSISSGIQTFQNAFVQRGDNSAAVSFPFFANDPETNTTNFFLSGTFTY